MEEMQVRSFLFADDGEIPNHPELPVLVYPGAFAAHPRDLEETFHRHGWTGSWTDGIYDYHHYHSNTHEVLGVQSGSAMLLIGGEAGQRLELETGDVIVLPAGTGHKKLEGSPDFQVVGAYPEGRTPNLRRRTPTDRTPSIPEIRRVPLPGQDPVYGEKGPLLQKWN